MSNPVAPPRILPIWPTVRETFAAAWRYSGYLTRIGWLWVLVGISLGLLLAWLFDRIAEPPTRATVLNTFVFETLQSVIRGFCLAAIAVPWHRHFLATGTVQPIQWWQTVMLYGLVATAIEFAFVVSSTLGSLHDAVFWLSVGAALAALYATTRLSFVLPALALGRDRAAATAWCHSRGNGRRLLVITVIVLAIPLILLLPMSEWIFAHGYLHAAVHEFAILMAYLFGIIALSITYRELVLNAEAAPRTDNRSRSR
jgi:hypothetical protein